MEEITRLFDGIKMPEDCTRRIASRLEIAGSNKQEGHIVMQKPESGMNRRGIAGALACLALVAVAGMAALGGGSEAAGTLLPSETEHVVSTDQLQSEISNLEQALADQEQESIRLREIVNGSAVVCGNLEYRDSRVYLIYDGQEYDITDGIPEAWLTEEEAAAKADFENGLHYTEGNITYTYTPGGDRTEYDTSLHTPFTEFVDGRVYFTANGENLDITDQFSEEEPFTYIFTDSHLLTHYIAIGGTPENPGYLEMIQMNWSVGFGASCGGMGVNTWNNEADARYGWETRAKEIFEPYGVYWAS